MAKKSENIVFQGTGRRKQSIARVRLMAGKGDITVNGKKLEEYFGTDILKVIVNHFRNTCSFLRDCLQPSSIRLIGVIIFLSLISNMLIFIYNKKGETFSVFLNLIYQISIISLFLTTYPSFIKSLC